MAYINGKDTLLVSITTVEESGGGKPYIDSSKLTDLRNFCEEGRHADIAKDPNFDTSNVTNFSRFFYNANWRFVAEVLPNLETTSAENMNEMFSKMNVSNISEYGYDLSNLEVDMRNVTNAYNMFAGSTMGKLPRLKNMQKVTNMGRFCYACPYLTEVNLPETSSATTFERAFSNACGRITKMVLNVTSGTNFTSSFDGATGLADFTPIGTFKASVSFVKCTALTVESAKNILRALENFIDTDKAYTCTITLSETTWALLDAEGNASPNGNAWRDYVMDIGWNT